MEWAVSVAGMDDVSEIMGIEAGKSSLQISISFDEKVKVE
jgi:hypothetical protein